MTEMKLDLMDDVFADLERASRKRQSREAEADPEAHKTTRVMANGKPANTWRVRGDLTNEAGDAVYYCWTRHRNAAGYFLAFRSTQGESIGRRDLWRAFKVKKQAEAASERRHAHHKAGEPVY